MDTERENAAGETPAEKPQEIYFPQGLPAFEKVKEFVIVSNEEEAPFLWLQAVKVPNLAFICIDPFLIFPQYRPDICDNDVETLGIESENDTFLLSIVTIHKEPHGITCNLVSPVLINIKKHTGKQVILNNHREYSVRCRIDNVETEDADTE